VGKLSDWTTDGRLVRAFRPLAGAGDHSAGTWPANSQVVVATHSPIVAAVPAARILELGDWGIRPARWEELGVVQSWRTFLGSPERFLHYLLTEDSGDE
jgi:hypothetical protein